MMVVLRAEKLILSMIYALVHNIDVFLVLYLIVVAFLILIVATNLVICEATRMGHVLMLKRIVSDFKFLRFFRYPTVIKLPVPIIFLVGVVLLFFWLLLFLVRHAHTLYLLRVCYSTTVSLKFHAIV